MSVLLIYIENYVNRMFYYMEKIEQNKGYLRSYGRKKGRAFGAEKARALESAKKEYAYSNDFFKGSYTDKELFLEIGSGMGDNLAGLAENNKDAILIGSEPYLDGVAATVKLIKEKSLSNVMIHNGDFREIIEDFPDKSLDWVFILFPDPWPKKRHHKKRLINQQTLDMLRPKMKHNANLVIATDHEDYSKWILNIMSARHDFIPDLRTVDNPFQPPTYWIGTKYEARARSQGLKPIYLHYKID